MAAADDDTFTYILYVFPGEKKSNLAINKISWGPTALSVDGSIRYEDIRITKRVFKSLPPWLTHVPTLVNIKTRTMYPGSKCFEELEAHQRQQQFAAGPQRSQQPHKAPARGSAPPQPLVVEDLRTILPKDPRDNPVMIDSPPAPEEEEHVTAAARDVFLSSSASNRGPARGGNRKSGSTAAAPPQFAREPMMLQISDAPTPVAAAPPPRIEECGDSSSGGGGA